MSLQNPHDWYLAWPGNYCKRCHADDPAEICVGGCKECPIDESGFPDPFKCPVHGAQEFWECPVPKESK